MQLKIFTGKSNLVLRKKAHAIEKITPAIKQLALDMAETLKTHQGLGLAGPQVGFNLRLIVVDLTSYCPDPKNIAAYQLTLINPTVIKKSWRKSITEEGCLSLPGQYYNIKRPEKVTVSALNLNAQMIKIETGGLLSKVIQHEIDHLDGILITDKI